MAEHRSAGIPRILHSLTDGALTPQMLATADVPPNLSMSSLAFIPAL